MAAGFELKSVSFRQEREANWRELERLVQRVERSGIDTLTARELDRLPKLYRSALSSLSVARSISLDKNLLEYLEGLTTRAYYCVYGTKKRLIDAIVGFFVETYPRLVRRYGLHIGLAGALMVLGFVTGFVITSGDMDRYYSFIGPEMAQGRDPAASTETLREVLYSGGGKGSDDLSAFAAHLFTHNTRVGLLCFAIGFVLGLPVFYLQFTNGMLLGAMAALYDDRGLSFEFWSWILPHGVTELLAIVLCGGAGLVVAQGLLLPGRYTRLENLRRLGRDAGAIMAGTVFLFLVAGLIEGFFRQLVTDLLVRYTVALGSAGFWIGYFTLAGRRPSVRRSS